MRVKIPERNSFLSCRDVSILFFRRFFPGDPDPLEIAFFALTAFGEYFFPESFSGDLSEADRSSAAIP